MDDGQMSQGPIAQSLSTLHGAPGAPELELDVAFAPIAPAMPPALASVPCTV
jgi:hypothetical protein